MSSSYESVQQIHYLSAPNINGKPLKSAFGTRLSCVWLIQQTKDTAETPAETIISEQLGDSQMLHKDTVAYNPRQTA